jgi:hypothetical protein
MKRLLLLSNSAINYIKINIKYFFILQVLSYSLNSQAQCPTTNYTICSGESYTLSTPSGYTNIKWYKNGQLISLASNQNYQVNNIGDYQWVAINSTTLCKDSLCCPVKITAGNCPNDYTICNGESFTLKAPNGYTNIKWYKNGIIIPTETNLNYTATNIGTYIWAGTNNVTFCRDSLCSPVNISQGVCESNYTPSAMEKVILLRHQVGTLI